MTVLNDRIRLTDLLNFFRKILEMKDAIKEIEKLQEEIDENPSNFGTNIEVEAAFQVLELLKVRLESLQ